MSYPTVTDGAYQGDLMIERIETTPPDLTPVEPGPEGYVVAHSETGHHHRAIAWMEGDDTPSDVAYLRPSSPDEMTAYLQVGPGAGALLVHDRPWDTHGTIHVPPGLYRLRRQEEYTPEGWRRVED